MKNDLGLRKKKPMGRKSSTKFLRRLKGTFFGLGGDFLHEGFLSNRITMIFLFLIL